MWARRGRSAAALDSVIGRCCSASQTSTINIRACLLGQRVPCISKVECAASTEKHCCSHLNIVYGCFAALSEVHSTTFDVLARQPINFIFYIRKRRYAIRSTMSKAR